MISHTKMISRVLKILGLTLIIGAIAFYFWPEQKYEPYNVDSAFQAQVDAFNLADFPPCLLYTSPSPRDRG